MANPIDHRGNRLDRVLAGAMNVAGIHVEAERGQVDGRERAQRGGRVVDTMADVCLDAQRHAVGAGLFGEPPQRVDGGLETLFITGLAARSAIDDRTFDCRRGLEGGGHLLRLTRRLLHGEDRQLVGPGQFLDLRHQLLPALEHEVLAHAVDCRDLDAVVAAAGDVREGGGHVVAAEENGIHT